MSNFDNTNRGALFVNEKRTKDTHPNYNGTIDIEGVEYWISGWKKTSNAGKTYLSLSVTLKEGQTAKPGKAKPAADDFDPEDDIPF